MSIGPCGPNPDPPLTERTREVAASVRLAAHEAARPGRDVRAMMARIFKRGTRWMDGLGESGKRLASDIRAIDQRAAKRVAENAQDIRNLLRGLSKKERIVVAKVLNRRPVPELDNRIPRRL